MKDINWGEYMGLLTVCLTVVACVFLMAQCSSHGGGGYR